MRGETGAPTAPRRRADCSALRVSSLKPDRCAMASIVSTLQNLGRRLAKLDAKGSALGVEACAMHICVAGGGPRIARDVGSSRLSEAYPSAPQSASRSCVS